MIRDRQGSSGEKLTPASVQGVPKSLLPLPHGDFYADEVTFLHYHLGVSPISYELIEGGNCVLFYFCVPMHGKLLTTEQILNNARRLLLRSLDQSGH